LGTSEFSGCFGPLCPKQQGNVLIFAQRYTAQREFQRRDDPCQEVYSILGLELSGVSLAKEHAFELDLSRKLAVPAFEGFTDFAARVRDGVLVNIFVRHEDHFPFW
jgi:hypothetical protein